jgi:hypothetical protein
MSISGPEIRRGRCGCCRPTPCDDDGMLWRCSRPLARFSVTLMPVRGASQGPVSPAAPIERFTLSRCESRHSPCLTTEEGTGLKAAYNRRILYLCWPWTRRHPSFSQLSSRPVSLCRIHVCWNRTFPGPRRGKHELKAPLLQSQPPLPPKNEENNGGNGGSAAFPIPQPTRAYCPNPYRPSLVRHWLEPNGRNPLIRESDRQK